MVQKFLSKFISVLLSCLMVVAIVPFNLAYAISENTGNDGDADKFAGSFESWKVENKFIKMGETNKVTVSLKNSEDVKYFEMQFFGGKAVMTYNPSTKMFEGDYKSYYSDFEYYEKFRYAKIVDKDNNIMTLTANDIIKKSKLDSEDLSFQVSDFIPQFKSFKITPKDIYKDIQVNVCADVDQGAKIREIYLHYDNNVSSDIILTKNSSTNTFTEKFEVGDEQKLTKIVFSLEDGANIEIQRQYFDMCGLKADDGDINVKQFKDIDEKDKDSLAKRFESMEVEKGLVKKDDTNKFSVKVKNPSDIGKMVAVYRHNEKDYFLDLNYNEKNGKFEGESEKLTSLNLYRLMKIYVYDKNDNLVTCFYRYEGYLKFEPFDFSVVTWVPTIKSFTLSKKEIDLSSDKNISINMDMSDADKEKVDLVKLRYKGFEDDGCVYLRKRDDFSGIGNFDIYRNYSNRDGQLSSITFYLDNEEEVTIYRDNFDDINLKLSDCDIILKDSNIKNTTVTTKSANYYYTGSQVKPSVTVKQGRKVLKEGKDYTLSYGKNKNVGKGTIIVKGKNDYKGSKTVEFDIKKRSINSTKVVATSIENQVYTGKEIKPSVTLKQGKVKLVENVDYTLSYKNNIKIGTATVVVKGKGNYTSTRNISFKIVPKQVKNLR